MFKKSITNKLEKYVNKYFAKHPNIKLIVVAGSVGKTSTKMAIATILSEKYRVRLHAGNHNTHLSAPLAILGIDFPDNPRNFWEWRRVFKAARMRIKSPAEVEPEIIIQELGTDRPGDIAKFGDYLKPDLAVITSVTPEHMEFFGNITEVAKEELFATNFSKASILNRDDISSDFLGLITNPNFSTYGSSAASEYNFEAVNFDSVNGCMGFVSTPEFGRFEAKVKVFGEHSLRPIAGAVAVATKMGLSPNEIISGMSKIEPVPGRMNIFRGIKNSILIDDTYNSSPAAATAALQALYQFSAPSKIVVLGSMNELGESSKMEHEKLASICDPLSLSWVITVGEEANNYIAPIARARGCQVRSFRNSIEAGVFLSGIIENGSLVLLKGSQGGIFLEEATKILLHDQDDTLKLVRQDEKWTKIKNDFFSSFSKIEDDEDV